MVEGRCHAHQILKSPRPARHHGEAFARDHAGHLGRVERRVMSAITVCRIRKVRRDRGRIIHFCNVGKIIRPLHAMLTKVFFRTGSLFWNPSQA